MKKIILSFLVINFFLAVSIFPSLVRAAACSGRCVTQDELKKNGGEPPPAGEGTCEADLVCITDINQGLKKPCPGRCLTSAEVEKLKAEPVPASEGSCDNGFICTTEGIQGPSDTNNSSAQTTQSNSNNTNTSIQKCPSGKGDCILLENPLDVPDTDVQTLIGIIIKSALGLIGSITLLMLVWGGFQWLTSAGNEEKITQGRNVMVYAIIGLMVVMSSYLLLTTYLAYLTGSK